MKHEQVNQKTVGDCGYLAYYRGRVGEVWATGSFAAQERAAKFFKAKKNWEVTVVLCERPDGSEVVHVATF